jgi:hypothetical protein
LLPACSKSLWGTVSLIPAGKKFLGKFFIQNFKFTIINIDGLNSTEIDTMKIHINQLACNEALDSASLRQKGLRGVAETVEKNRVSRAR